VLLGKSSSGKNYIQEKLIEEYSYTGLVSTTSRRPRENEKEGVDYHYVTNEEFEKQIADGKMIEYREYHPANGETWYYGLSKKAFEIKANKKVVILELYGLKELKKFLKGKNIKLTSYYISANQEIRTERAKARGSFDEAEWERRLIADNNDFTVEELASNIDYMIKNETTVEDAIKSMLCYKGEIYLDLREFNIANINSGCNKKDIIAKYGNILYEKDIEVLFSLGYFFYKNDTFLHNVYDVKRHILVG
jgi:guanylate kinase